MSGKGSKGGRGSGRGGARAANEKQGGRGVTSPPSPGGGGVGRNYPTTSTPLKGIGRGTTHVKLYEISQTAKDELIALEGERDNIKQQQFENSLKSETENKKLKDLEGSEILLQREINKLEHHNSKTTQSRIDDSKLVESLLKKHKDEYNVLVNEKKVIKKTLDDLEKEQATLAQRSDANKSKLEKKKEDLAKERLKYSQRQIDKSKNQKPTQENPAKVEQKHPCQQEIDACELLLKVLRGKTRDNRKKPQNEKNQPEEEIEEEEPKPNTDESSLSFNWVQTISLERISCIIPKTIGEAKELISVVQDRKRYFYNLGVPPEKRLTRTEKNGKKDQNPDDVEEEGDLPADEEMPFAVVQDADPELDAGAGGGVDVEQGPTEEPDEEGPFVEDQAVVEETVDEEPVVEETVDEEPAIEETVNEEPAIEETVDEEPVIEETVNDEPVVEETVDDNPVVEDPVDDNPVVEDPVDVEQEPVNNEPVLEETTVADETTVEEEQEVNVNEDDEGGGEHPKKEDEAGDDEHDVEGFTLLGGDDEDDV